MLSLHPAEEKFIYNLVITKGWYDFLKKKRIKILVIKKKVLLLHPLTQREGKKQENKFIDILDWQHIRIRVISFSSIIKNWIPSKMIIVDKIIR